MQFIIENKAIILGALFAISEVLALIPSVKSSGVFDFIFRTLQSLTKPQA
jgi:hypothetical protein